jgi:hypothetical protein
MYCSNSRLLDLNLLRNSTATMKRFGKNRLTECGIDFWSANQQQRKVDIMPLNICIYLQDQFFN